MTWDENLFSADTSWADRDFETILTQKQQGIVVTDVCDFLKKNIPPRKLILDPWLPERGICMIFAARGAGKTHLALAIAHTVATGGEFLGWKASRPYKVLYLDGEMSAPDLKARLEALCKARGAIQPGQLSLITPEEQNGSALPDLSDRAWHSRLDKAIEGMDLVIVDNISSLCRTGNENDAESWQQIQDWALRHKAAGKTFLFIHHAGKGGSQRGTSKREDVMDSILGLRPPKGHQPTEGARFELHFDKSRGFSKGSDPFVAQLKEVGGVQVWVRESLDDAQDRKLQELLDKGLTQSEIAEELGVHKSTVSRRVAKQPK